VERPELTVKKYVSPAFLAFGKTVTYTIRYTNTGGGVFTNLLFTDTIDSQVSTQAISGNCTGSSVVVCSDSNLAPGASGQFTVAVANVLLGNGDVTTNVVAYLVANQTEVLPQATSNVLEVPVSNKGAAADFVGSPLSGLYPLTVTFTDLSSGTGINSSRIWNFGDGSSLDSNSALTVTHVYTQPGDYTVTLTISTGLGANTRTRVSYVTVGDAKPYKVYLPLVLKSS
jgi:uncharacterized repeat protein (TIGR01451 family)